MPMNPGDAEDVAYDCITRITGSDREFQPGDPLEAYGVHTDVQGQLIVVLILNDKNIGVRAYGYTIDPNALRDISKDWPLGLLSNRIQQAAQSHVQDSAHKKA
jgi:hypothetical protein